jgi:hypothetical protein
VTEPEAEVRDRGGNLLVGCLAIGGLGSPVWLLTFVIFQSVYVQGVSGAIIPQLRGMVDGDEAARQLLWELNTNLGMLITSGLVATAVSVPVVVGVAVLVGGGGWLSLVIQRVRDRAARRRYEQMVGEVVLSAPARVVPDPTGSPGSPSSPAE